MEKKVRNDTETQQRISELVFHCCVMKSTKTSGSCLLFQISVKCYTSVLIINQGTEDVRGRNLPLGDTMPPKAIAVISQQENLSLYWFSKTQTMVHPSLLSRDYSMILLDLTIRYISLVIRLNFPLLNFIPAKYIPWLQYETLAGSKLTMCLFASM